MVDIREHNRVVKKALLLGEIGFPVFPCNADKSPAVPPPGNKLASVDADIIIAMWHRYPGPLIGYRTGETSGVAVLDFDFDRHPEAVNFYNEYRRFLPDTWTNRTRSGGLHLLYQHQPGRANSASKICIGVDVRGENGHAIWWPGAGYEIVRDAPLAPWPMWLDTPLPQKKRREVEHSFSANGKLDNYGKGALDSACRNILDAPNGRQHTTLYYESLCIGRLAGAGGVPHALALDVLLWASRRMPAYTTPWEIEKNEATVRSAFATGLQQPRGACHG
jgi:bifunctional DNA primase/polymerase-like protein